MHACELELESFPWSLPNIDRVIVSRPVTTDVVSSSTERSRKEGERETKAAGVHEAF